MVSWSEMPRSPGHVFYDRLQSVLIEGGFDGFAEEICRPYYAARMSAPSVPPGRTFHTLDRGGLRRTWLRGRENVHKRYLLHVAGHNLSLLIAIFLNDLALFHEAQGNYAEAAPLYRRSLAIRETFGCSGPRAFSQIASDR